MMKGSGWILKALLNFPQIVGVEEYFLECIASFTQVPV